MIPSILLSRPFKITSLSLCFEMGFVISLDNKNAKPLMYFAQHCLSLVTFLGLFFSAVLVSFLHPQWSALCTLVWTPGKTFSHISGFLGEQVQWERRHCYHLKAPQKYKHFSWYFCCTSYFGIESCSGKNREMPKVY